MNCIINVDGFRVLVLSIFTNKIKRCQCLSAGVVRVGLQSYRNRLELDRVRKLTNVHLLNTTIKEVKLFYV